MAMILQLGSQDGLPVWTRRQGSEQLTYLQLLKLADKRRAGRLERFDKIGRIVVENEREVCFRNIQTDEDAKISA